MSDITPGEENDVPVGTSVVGNAVNPNGHRDFVLGVFVDPVFPEPPPRGQIHGIRAGGSVAIFEPGGVIAPAGAGVIAQGGAGSTFPGEQPGVGVIGQAGRGGDADGVRGFGSGSFSGVAGFGDSDFIPNSGIGVFGRGGGPSGPGIPGGPGVKGVGGGIQSDGVQGFGNGNFSGVAGFGDSSDTANSGIGVFGQGGGPQPPPPGQQAQPGGPGVLGIGGKNQFGNDADGVQGFGSGRFSGVAGFGDPTSNGTGVFGQGRGPGAPGVRGIGTSGPNTTPNSPVGVYGQAGSGNANGVEGHGGGNFAGVAGFGDSSDTANSGIGVLAVGGIPAIGSNQPGGPGVYAIGAGGPPVAPLSQAVGVFGVGGAADGPGVVGQGGSAVADGVQGFSASGSAIRGESNNGVGVLAFSGSRTGLVAEGDTSVPGTIGLFAAGNAFAAQFDGNVFVSGNFTVSGTKSAVVPFPDGSHRQLYCLESPQSWFEDFGFGQLAKGQAQIVLDPDFATTVDTDSYHVFITEYEDNNALYVAERTSTGFKVRAKASTANGTFSYRVVAKRKDIAPARLEKVTLPTESVESIKSRVAKS